MLTGWLATLERANPGFGGQEGQEITSPHDLLESVPNQQYLIAPAIFSWAFLSPSQRADMRFGILGLVL